MLISPFLLLSKTKILIIPSVLCTYDYYGNANNQVYVCVIIIIIIIDN